jgi:hypothetical protein
MRNAGVEFDSFLKRSVEFVEVSCGGRTEVVPAHQVRRILTEKRKMNTSTPSYLVEKMYHHAVQTPDQSIEAGLKKAI